MGEMEALKKRVEASERGLRDIITRVPDGILVLDAEGTVVFANPAAEMLMGREPGGLRACEFGFPTLAGETTEIDITCRAGQPRLAEMRVVEIEWEGAFAMVASLRDITVRKQAEAALRESEARYRQVFENALTGICISRPSGEVVTCNAAFLRIFGFGSVEEARLRRLETLYPVPEQRREFLDRLRREKTLELYEAELRRVDGTPVHVIMNVLGSFAPDGELELITAYSLDVSDRKRLEEQLRHAQKMDAVGRLAGGLAHDFNNLLTVIAGRAAVLLDGVTANDEPRETVDEILRATDQAASITSRLLTCSRRQTGKPVELPVGAVLTGMERLLRAAAGGAIRMSIAAGPEAGVIRADRTQIEQVILNLVVNARDAMPGGGSISVEAAAVDLDNHTAPPLGLAAGRYTRIVVSDTGCGMSPEVKQHLFEPFFTTKEPGKGTGLGLSTIYGIVKQCGGAIAVESEPGRGATFRIYFPLVAESAPLPHAAPAPVRAPGGSEAVLVVDDEPGVRKIACTILGRRGYQVIEAADALDALRIARAKKFDLLVTDIVMPDMNGRDLAARVREIRPGTRVLFISGYNEDAFACDGRCPGPSAFLPKPFTPDTLSRSVRAVLDGETPQAAR